MKFTIVDKLHRSILYEGRSQGMGFAFCKRNGDTLTTVNPPSPCKDYLNDVIYSEMTGKDYKACGLSTTKQDIFSDGKGYLLAKICGAGASLNAKYSTMDRDIKDLEDNHLHAVKIMNEIEEGFKLKDGTEIVRIEANLFILIIPDFWCKATYLISLYTLIFRNAVKWDGKGDAMAFLKAADGKWEGDCWMVPDAMEKLAKLLKGPVPAQDWGQVSSPHSLGIISYAI